MALHSNNVNTAVGYELPSDLTFFFPNILKRGRASLLIKGFVCSFPERAKKVLHYQIWRKGQQDGAILTIGIKQRGICLSGSLFDVELGKGSIIETRIASQGEMNEKCSFVDS